MKNSMTNPNYKRVKQSIDAQLAEALAAGDADTQMKASVLRAAADEVFHDAESYTRFISVFALICSEDLELLSNLINGVVAVREELGRPVKVLTVTPRQWAVE